MRSKTFTGWHMTGILVAFFGVVIIVNLTMASYAVSTFGGVVVENSYVASQEFNDWLDEAKDERALGWSASVARDGAGHVTVVLAGAPDSVALSAEARHPLGRLPDLALTFSALGGGRYISHEVLPAGRWTIRLAASDGNRKWRSEERL
ncbi:FixH family protein [Croceibacterium aestuarii]|uniref:FixH family protein n=1 Tax=Croceibacterium aestuarii TaxID=3064139 RepID=UPI00272DD84D|nr:FixH family protein [Croceibacterium sp. D39]